MSVGLYFLTRLLRYSDTEEQSREYLRLLASGIEEKFFQSQQELDIFKLMQTHFNRYDKLPTEEVVEVELDLNLPEHIPDEPPAYWYNEMRRQYVITLLGETIPNLKRLVDNGADAEMIASKLGDLYYETSAIAKSEHTHTLLEVVEQAADYHDRKQRDMLEDGILFGFPYIDRVIGGAQPGDFITLVARTGVGKTFMSLRMAQGAAALGSKVLYFNTEMRNEAAGRRLAALGAGVNGLRLRHGRLPFYIRDAVTTYIEHLKSLKSDNLILTEGQLNMTTTDVLVKIRQHRPDVVFVDGAYLIRNSYGGRLVTTERIKMVAEELKQIALMENIPLIPIYQYAKGGDKKGIEGIGWSDAIAQVASIILSLTNEAEEEAANEVLYDESDISYKLLEIIKGREGERGKIKMLFDMIHSRIEEVEVLEGHQLFMDVETEEHDLTDTEE